MYFTAEGEVKDILIEDIEKNVVNLLTDISQGCEISVTSIFTLFQMYFETIFKYDSTH